MTRTYSAIVPNYNDGDKIHASLASLAAQDFPFHEIIIVDDASTDGSVERITALLTGIPQAKLLQHEHNKGVVGALNTGIAAATGDYIFLCSANDTYDPKMVAWCEEALSRHPEAGIVSGNVAAYDQAKERFTHDMKLPLPQKPAYYAPEQLTQAARRAAIHFNGGANALRLDRVRHYGGLIADLRWHSDWFLNLMIALDTGVSYIPENFLTCRLEGKKSYSSNRFHWKTEREVIRASLVHIARFPTQAALFRRAALLPKYDLRALPLLLTKKFRGFITPLLVWRLIMMSLVYRSKYIFPRPLLTALRPFVRL